MSEIVFRKKVAKTGHRTIITIPKAIRHNVEFGVLYEVKMVAVEE
jgi:hypothetical protein